MTEQGFKVYSVWAIDVYSNEFESNENDYIK